MFISALRKVRIRSTPSQGLLSDLAFPVQRVYFAKCISDLDPRVVSTHSEKNMIVSSILRSEFSQYCLSVVQLRSRGRLTRYLLRSAYRETDGEEGAREGVQKLGRTRSVRQSCRFPISLVLKK